ncbi:hypothetical protein llap_11782 [Limosa lapponica baueri]|uniref:Uncharacterized protein n=1 Tax=Limosa lapponica baueri TaxID=1758121 RepID=A0A2I0TVW1_LIMLA|nr:hypothetical protein llap_11782 [Limosa lapponica baueri]
MTEGTAGHLPPRAAGLQAILHALHGVEEKPGTFGTHEAHTSINNILKVLLLCVTNLRRGEERRGEERRGEEKRREEKRREEKRREEKRREEEKPMQ